MFFIYLFIYLLLSFVLKNGVTLTPMSPTAHGLPASAVMLDDVNLVGV